MTDVSVANKDLLTYNIWFIVPTFGTLKELGSNKIEKELLTGIHHLYFSLFSFLPPFEKMLNQRESSGGAALFHNTRYW